MKTYFRPTGFLLAVAAVAAFVSTPACSAGTRSPSAPPTASLEPLVDAHFATINELDATRRLERMPAVYTPGFVFHDPGPPAVGYQAVSAAYGKLHSKFPSAVFRRDIVLDRDGLLRVGWMLGRPGEDPVHRGEDIIRIENGRIAELWVFIQPEPTTSSGKHL